MNADTTRTTGTTIGAGSAHEAATEYDPSRPDFAARRFDRLRTLQDEAAATYLPALDLWAVTRYDEVRAVLGDPETFTSERAFSGAGPLSAEALAVYPLSGPLFRYSPVNLDGPGHARLRSPLVALLSPARLRALAGPVAADVDELLAGIAADLAGGGVVDLRERLALPVPVRTICHLFGLPTADAGRFRGWSEAFLAFQVPGLAAEAQLAAARGLAEFDDYVRQAVRGEAVVGSSGLVAELARLSAAGEVDLDEDALVGLLANVLFAGHETTVHTLANAFLRLLGPSRSLWERLAAGELDHGRLVEEVLRLDTSVIGFYRRATAEARVGDVVVPAGALLWVSYAAANRDPRAFVEPDSFDPDREDEAHHVSFGHGVHFCVGATLARVQLAEVLARTARRLPDLVLAPGEPPQLQHIALRAALAVPVRLG